MCDLVVLGNCVNKVPSIKELARHSALWVCAGTVSVSLAVTSVLLRQLMDAPNIQIQQTSSLPIYQNVGFSASLLTWSGLLALHVFGDEKKSKINEEQIQPALLPTTQVSIELMGVFAEFASENGAAILKSNDQSKLFKAGEEVSGVGTLVGVYKDSVVLRREGRLESLFFKHKYNNLQVDLDKNGPGLLVVESDSVTNIGSENFQSIPSASNQPYAPRLKEVKTENYVSLAERIKATP